MDEPARDGLQATCGIVGGGPAGVMLALLLARRGVPTVLLEEHTDFDRQFRGDSLQPSTMEIVDELGLADRLLALPHAKLRHLTLRTPRGVAGTIDFSRLPTKFPYIVMMPQARFLDFMAKEATRSPACRLMMGARVEALIEEAGAVRGVRYRLANKPGEVRAALVVACDGRFSRLRHLAGLTPVETAATMDVLWFRLPKAPGDQDAGAADLMAGGGGLLIALDRDDYWQVGFVIRKGGYQTIRAAGLDRLRASVAAYVPRFRDRVGAISDWQQVAVLSVEANMLPTWYRPGLLFLGDAAHTMSPVGGVGINYAIQDAVVAANELVRPLAANRVDLRDLARVQALRERPVRFIQRAQRMIQNRIVSAALADTGAVRDPFPWPLRLLLRVPGLRALPARALAFGLRRPRVRA